MLIRKYIVHIDSGNSVYPFQIENTTAFDTSAIDIDIADPVSEEAAAPSLTVLPMRLFGRASHESDIKAAFRDNLRSSFFNQKLPPTILDALCGDPSDWKIIRCVPRIGEVFFVLVNPAIYNNPTINRGALDFTQSLENQLKLGQVWAHLDTEEYHGTLKITAPDNPKNSYIIKTSFRSFTFYECVGEEIMRRSEVYEEDERGASTIEVTEYI